MCDCKVGPGKFEGEPAETCILWEFSLDGGGELHGPEGATYDYIAGPFEDCTRELNPMVAAACREVGYCDPCIAEAFEELSRAKGACVGQSEQGFVWSKVAETEAEHTAMLQAMALDDAETEEVED